MNKINRRDFLVRLGAGAAAGAFGGCRMFCCPPGSASHGTPKIRFGVISDIHLCSAPNNLIDRPADVHTFRKALEWYRDRGVDAVLAAGDLTDNGTVDQMMNFAGVWNSVFPGGKLPDGRKVEKLFVCGNHDWEGWTYGKHAERVYKDPAERDRQIFAHNRPEKWEKVFGEPFSPVYVKTVNGFTFIGAHWGEGARCRGKEENAVADPGEAIAGVAPKIDPRTPFFYFQHPHPKDTCYAGWGWGQDDGRSTRALSPFPNAIAFSGHSHFSLTDDRTIWQGAFTSIGTSSLRYTGLPGDIAGASYENAHGGKGSADKVADVFPQWDGRQGMLVEVYDDRVVIARREFYWGRSLGDDWVLPLPAAEKKPYSYEARRAKEAPPRFPTGAKPKVVSYKRKSRGGGETLCWEVVVPAAICEPSTRPQKYEAKIVLTGGEVFGVKYLLAPGYNMPPSDLRAMAAVCMPVSAKLLPQGKPFRFEVTPISALGTRGVTLVSESITVEPEASATA
ncbi:MAG: metallophosphoesterase [Kiritimatiellae bacterium]|nr:metallophosphoesterase [Kiritimatiellia bacterium]